MKKILALMGIGLAAILVFGSGIALASNGKAHVKPAFNVMPYARFYGEHRGFIVEKVAKFLKMEPGQLRKELKSGKTMNDILTQKNVTKDQLHTFVSTTVKSWLDKFATRHFITADKETELMNKFEAGYNARIDGLLSTPGNELLKMKFTK